MQYNVFMAYPFFLKNGNLLSFDQSVIPLTNIEYQYGFGVYETLKVRNGIVYFSQQHLERLIQSAKIIELDHPYEIDTLGFYLQQLVDTVYGESFNIKIILIGGEKKDNAQLFMLPLAPYYPQRKFYAQGVTSITIQYERLFPNAKTLNMLPSYLAYKKAKDKNCYDALLLNRHGNILEGTRTNFFTMKDRVLYTAPKKTILDGVTRQTVIAVAKEKGFSIEEWDISLSQLKEYDAAFFTSTSAKILPIHQIDDFVFPSFPSVLRKLMNHYDDFLEKSKGIFLRV